MTTSANCRRMLLALLPTLMLGGCNQSAQTIRPNLPAAPSTFGSPVSVPAIKQGDDVRKYAARTKRQLLIANQRLRDDKTFYDDVQEEFGK